MADAGPPAERLFHAVVAREWRARPAGSSWAPASLEREGFVHLSRESQLAGSLELHFPAGEELLLLELDPARVADELRFEPSRGGELFPHLYRALERDDVRAWWLLPPATGARLPANWKAGATPGAPPRGALQSP